MTDNKNDPGLGKDTSRINDPGQPKRPHATLDLKATELKTAASDAGKPQITPVKAAEAAKSTEPPKVETKSEPKMEEKKSATSASAQKVAGGSRFGRFVSHVAAGAAGGMLALLGADWIAPQIGFSSSRADLTAATKVFEQKIAGLEAAVKEKAAARETSKKLAAAESRLAELEKLGPAVGTLSDAQSKFTEDAKAFSEKIAADSGDTGPAARVAKLEQRLNTMAAAATSTPNAGTLPQLAAITGRMGDLESEVAKQLADLRKALSQDVDTRLSGVVDASTAAKSGAERLDKDLGGLKSETIKLAERIESLKAESDRLAEAVRIAGYNSSTVKANVETLKSDIDAKFKASAKPNDVTAAVAPIAGKLAALEQSVAGVVRSEDDRKANAERIVLSLELQNLKRALDRGQPFAAEFTEVEKAAGGRVDLTALQPFKDKGVTPIADLQKEFRTVLYQIVDAGAEPAEGSVIDKLITGAKSVVRVRKISHTPDDQSAEAIVARMETALKDGQLEIVMAEAKKLPEKAAAPAAGWLAKTNARAKVEGALAKVEADLKASLSGQAPVSDPAKQQ